MFGELYSFSLSYRFTVINNIKKNHGKIQTGKKVEEYNAPPCTAFTQLRLSTHDQSFNGMLKALRSPVIENPV